MIGNPTHAITLSEQSIGRPGLIFPGTKLRRVYF
jgi:hypothetical protein